MLATARRCLKEQCINGLHQATILKALIQKLPVIMQEQYAYEKVTIYMVDPCVIGLITCQSYIVTLYNLILVGQ